MRDVRLRTEKERFLARFPDVPAMEGEHFNIEGKPISFAEWGWLHSDRHYTIIFHTRRRGILVSTVWLGINHGWGEMPPIIFETMIFRGGHDGYQERYATLDEAIVGHKYACTFAFSWTARLRRLLHI